MFASSSIEKRVILLSKEWDFQKIQKFVNRVLCVYFLLTMARKNNEKVRNSPSMNSTPHQRHSSRQVEVEGAKKGLRAVLNFEITLKKETNVNV